MRPRDFEKIPDRSELERTTEELKNLDNERISLLNQVAEMEAKKESLSGRLPESQQKKLLSLKKQVESLIERMEKLGATWVK